MENCNTRSTFVPLYKMMLFVCALLMFMIGGVKTAWADVTYKDYIGVPVYYTDLNTGNTGTCTSYNNGCPKVRPSNGSSWQYAYANFISDVNITHPNVYGSSSVKISGNTWLITTDLAVSPADWNAFGPYNSRKITNDQQIYFMYNNEELYTEYYGKFNNTSSTKYGLGIENFDANNAKTYPHDIDLSKQSGVGHYININTLEVSTNKGDGCYLVKYKGSDSKSGMELYEAAGSGNTRYYLLKNAPSHLTKIYIIPYLSVLAKDNDWHSYYNQIAPEVGTRVGNTGSFSVTRHTHSDKDNDGACDECGKVYRSRHTLTINGKLNGSDSGNTGSYGTFNLKIDGRNLMSGQTSWSGYIADGTSYTITPSAKSGYRYMGANSGGTSLPASKGTISDTMPASDQTVRLSFDSIYTIVFNGNNANGGSTSSMNNLAYSDSKTLSQNGFYRYGYSFSGWTGNANGTGSSYSNKQTVSKLSATPNGKVTLYAKWTPVTYKIYYTLFGSNATLARTYNIESPTFTLHTPSYEGYTFKGWVGGIDKKDPVRDANGKIYSTPTGSITIPKGTYGDYFFRAVFEKNHSSVNGDRTDDVYVAHSEAKGKQY